MKNVNRKILTNKYFKAESLYESYLETVLNKVSDEDGLKLDELNQIILKELS